MNFLHSLVFVLACLAFMAVSVSADKKKGDMNSYLLRTGQKFIREVSEREGIIKLKSGMLVEIIKSSTDPNAKSPKATDQCDVTYTGTLKDGTKFDSGRTSFAPNQVIKGWTEALQLMTEGDHWKLYIPFNLAYGERGAPPRIPAYAPLVFELEIHKVNGNGKTAEEARQAFEEAKAPPATEL